MRGLIVLAALPLLAGCDAVDPYRRAGMWQPTGANTLNLAAMVERPGDLVRGRGTRGTPGVEAAPAVSRYWAARAAPLPSTTSQGTVAVTTNTSGSAPGATP